MTRYINTKKELGIIEEKEGIKGTLEKARIASMFSYVSGSASMEYLTLLKRLAQAKKISPEQKEFMDRMERLLEYTMGKKSRIESTNEDKSVIVHITSYKGASKGEGPGGEDGLLEPRSETPPITPPTPKE